MPCRLILASASPRRREILASVGIAFEVVPSTYPEPALPGTTPSQLAFVHALEKARDVARHHPDRYVLAADTVVELDGEALGKPRDVEHAHHMLTRLAGRRHDVHTGFALIQGDYAHAECVTTQVEMYDLSADEISAYIATGDPLDKAGAYGIQGLGSLNIVGIHGDYFNVVGLPIARVVRALKLGCLDN